MSRLIDSLSSGLVDSGGTGGGSGTGIAIDGTNGAITYTNFVPSAAPSYQEGRIWYDSTTNSLSVYDNYTGTSLQLGKELVLDARNNSGSPILNGQAVYISGALGQNPTIALARADSLATSQIIGVATHDIANNSNGKITLIGLVNDVNTSSFSDGAALYLSAATLGGLTATPPASPNNVVFVGYVAHSHITQGKILVVSDRAITNNNSLGTSQTAAPSENAVKQYVDGGLGGKQNSDADLTAIAATSGLGYLRRTATDTWTNDQGILISQSTISPNDTVNISALTANAPSTNANIVIAPKGTGGVSTSVADGTAIGGNIIGTSAISLVTDRSAASQGATGAYAISVGRKPTASGQDSIAIGSSTVAAGTDSIALGTNTRADATGAICIQSAARSGNKINAFVISALQESTAGDSQQVFLKHSNRTTDATQTSLTADSSTVRSSGNIYSLTSYQGCTAQILVHAIKKGSDGTDHKSWTMTIRAYRGAGAGTTTASIIQSLSDGTAGTTNWAATVLADTINGGFYVAVTGEAATNIQWSASISAIENIYS